MKTLNTQKTTEVSFVELEQLERQEAMSQMLSINKKYAYPADITWDSVRSIKSWISVGYMPSKHFSFYLDDDRNVKVERI